MDPGVLQIGKAEIMSKRFDLEDGRLIEFSEEEWGRLCNAVWWELTKAALFIGSRVVAGFLICWGLVWLAIEIAERL